MITLSTLRINNLFNDHCKSLFYLSHIMRKHIYNSILPVSIINSLYQPIFPIHFHFHGNILFNSFISFLFFINSILTKLSQYDALRVSVSAKEQ